MAALTDQTAQDWISTHLQPSDAQMEHLFQHVYGDLGQVLTVCRLSNRQKYAVLQQGVTCIVDVRMLGSSVQTIRDTFKHFNSLTDARGGTNFGAIHYTRIHALTEYVRDRQRRNGQVPDAAGSLMRSWKVTLGSTKSLTLLGVGTGETYYSICKGEKVPSRI